MTTRTISSFTLLPYQGRASTTQLYNTIYRPIHALSQPVYVHKKEKEKREKASRFKRLESSQV